MAEYTKLRNKNHGYMTLDSWQKSMNLSTLIFGIVYKENRVDFKLRSQIADAAQSVSSNIAEGYGRRSIKEYIQFLYIALGSLAETLTRAIGLKETGQITQEQFQQIDLLHYEVENKLLRQIESLQKKRATGTWNDRISDEEAIYLTEKEDH